LYTVYEDFNREPPADVDEVSISCAQKVQKTAEQLKAEANELFTSGDFAGAQDIYTEAMSLLGDQHTDQRLRAILYSNRSAAMLRLAEESTDGNKLLERCMEDCDIAIQADPGYYKAWFWLAKCHEARGELEEAVSAAQNAASVESISHQNARAVESFISSLKCRLEPAISHSSSKSKESLLAAKILSRGRAPEELESENREDENRAPASGMECPQPATVNKRRNRPQTNKKRVGGKSKRILRAIDTSPSLELAITLSALGEGKHLQAIFGEELTEERLCRTLQAIRALALSEVPTSRKGAPMLIKELAGVRRLPAVLLMIPPEDRRWASDTVMRLKEQGLLENTSDITIFLRD
jgi:tetratricopeptide (TPR) repeat protein